MINHSQVQLHLHHPAALRGLLPLAIYANQAAHRTRKANKAIIEIRPAERGRRRREIAEVRQELELASIALTLKYKKR